MRQILHVIVWLLFVNSRIGGGIALAELKPGGRAMRDNT
jgi:hypothetical protein